MSAERQLFVVVVNGTKSALNSLNFLVSFSGDDLILELRWEHRWIQRKSLTKILLVFGGSDGFSAGTLLCLVWLKAFLGQTNATATDLKA